MKLEIFNRLTLSLASRTHTQNCLSHSFLRLLHVLFKLFSRFHGSLGFSDVAIGASLSGGYEASQGQLQVFVNGRWGAVCNNGWGSTNGKCVILVLIFCH